MDPTQVVRDAGGIMRCRQCGFPYELTPSEVAERSESGLEAVRAALAAASRERRSVRPAPDVWSVNGYTAHLAEASGVILRRIAAVQDEDRPFLEYYDEAESAVRNKQDEIPAEDSLPELERNVRTFAERVRGFDGATWTRRGVHERAGDIQLSEIAHDMAHELNHHAADIRAVGVEQRVP